MGPVRPSRLSRRAVESGASGSLDKDAPAGQLADAIRDAHAGRRVIDPGLAAAAIADGVSPLTERERDVLTAAACGSREPGIGVRRSRSHGTRAGCDDRAIGRLHGGYTAGMFGRERVVPSILAAVGAVLAGVLVGSGFAGHSAGGVINAVAVQAVMPPAAPASIPDPSDPSAAKGASVGRRVAIALRGAPVAHVAAPAATRPSRPARAAAPKRPGEVKADPPAPRPAASRASQRRHHPHAGRGHRHPARRHGAGRHHARGYHRRHRAHHQR